MIIMMAIVVFVLHGWARDGAAITLLLFCDDNNYGCMVLMAIGRCRPDKFVISTQKLSGSLSTNQMVAHQTLLMWSRALCVDTHKRNETFTREKSGQRSVFFLFLLQLKKDRGKQKKNTIHTHRIQCIKQRIYADLLWHFNILHYLKLTRRSVLIQCVFIFFSSLARWFIHSDNVATLTTRNVCFSPVFCCKSI